MRARELLNDPRVLLRVARTMAAMGYAHDLGPAQLAYVALTSRLLARPMNLAFVGEEAAGKNATLEAALALIPPKAVYRFRGGSPAALVYTAEDFRHRVVLFEHADAIPRTGAGATAVRTLAEHHEIRHEYVWHNPRTGQRETRARVKPGPTGLITTSTRPIRPPLSTHLLRVPVRADAGTIGEVLRQKGQEAAGTAPPPPDVGPFWAFQRWLAVAGERRVIVPFAEALNGLLPVTAGVRTCRDVDQLLTCVKTIALLHQRHRRPTRGGAILATGEDYRRARQLLLESFQATAVDGVTPAIRETVNAIEWGERPINETELRRRLGCSKSSTSWRVGRATAGGWLVDENRRPGAAARLRRGAPLPGDVSPLPAWEDVEAAFLGLPPDRVDRRFFDFAAILRSQWPNGVTAAEWARWVHRDRRAVRERLDALVRAERLDRDPATGRYTLSAAARELLGGPAAAPRGLGGAEVRREVGSEAEPPVELAISKAQALVEKIRRRQISVLDALWELGDDALSYSDEDLRFIAERAAYSGIARHARHLIAAREDRTEKHAAHLSGIHLETTWDTARIHSGATELDTASSQDRPTVQVNFADIRSGPRADSA